MKLIIRSFQAKDLPSLKILFIELQSYEKGLLPDRASGELIFDSYWQELNNDIKEKNGDVVIAEMEGIVVGFIAYYLEKDILNEQGHLYISDLVVNKKYRGQGVAAKLMKNAEHFAKEKNTSTIRVAVLANNPSQSFYQKLGYKLETLELKKIT